MKINTDDWLAIPVLLEKSNAFQKFGISEALNASEEPIYMFHLGPFCSNS